jgi:hypothetical protein
MASLAGGGRCVVTSKNGNRFAFGVAVVIGASRQFGFVAVRVQQVE